MVRLQECLNALRLWFAQNNLVINPEKSEASLFSTRQRLTQLHSLGLTSVSVAGHSIPITGKIKTLGVTLDSPLTFRDHIRSVAQSSIFHIRTIKHIRHLISDTDAKQLTTSLVQSKLDYANSLLYNTSSINITSLQRIQNTLARVCLYKSALTAPSKSLLATLHWLPISERVIYKTACIIYTLLHTKEPSYLLEHLNKYAP